MGLITGDNISRCDSIVEGLWRWARAWGGGLGCWNTFISCERCKAMIQSYLGPSSDSGISSGQKSKCKVHWRGKQFQCLQHTDGAKLQLQALLEMRVCSSQGSKLHFCQQYTKSSSTPTVYVFISPTLFNPYLFLTRILRPNKQGDSTRNESLSVFP